MISIKNLRGGVKLTEAWQVRVDRSSVLGNPFDMCHDERRRDEVCDKYVAYFEQQRKCNEAFVNELRRLYCIHRHYGKLELFCWCAPRRCHAETIKAFLEKW